MAELDGVSFFSPVYFPAGKNPEESLHWLGRLVEPLFDFGQRGYTGHDAKVDVGIVVDVDNRKLSKCRIALKVFTVALKIILLAAGFFILGILGKLIYRTANFFVVVPRPNVEHLKKEVKQLIDKFSKKGKAYGDLSKQVEGFYKKDFALEHVREVKILYQELSGAVKELNRVSGPTYQQAITKEMAAELVETRHRLTALQEKFVAFFDNDKQKALVKDALDKLEQTAEKRYGALQRSVESWKEKQDKILDQIEPEKPYDWRQLHKQLREASKGVEIREYRDLEKFRSAVRVFNEMIPKFYESDLIEKIDTIQQLQGIPNLGNTCYMNSLLQALCANPGFYSLVNRELILPKFKSERNGEVVEPRPMAEPRVVPLSHALEGLGLIDAGMSLKPTEKPAKKKQQSKVDPTPVEAPKVDSAPVEESKAKPAPAKRATASIRMPVKGDTEKNEDFFERWKRAMQRKLATPAVNAEAAPVLVPKAAQMRVKHVEVLNHVQLRSHLRCLHESLRVFILAYRSQNPVAIRIAAKGFYQILLDMKLVQPGRQEDAAEIMGIIFDKLAYPTFEVSRIRQFTKHPLMDQVKGEDKDQAVKDQSLDPRFNRVLTETDRVLKIPMKDPDGGIYSTTLQGLIDHYFGDHPDTSPNYDIDGVRGPSEWNEKVRLTTAPPILNLALTRFETTITVDENGEYHAIPHKVQDQVHLPVGNIVDLRGAFAEGVLKEGDSGKYEIVSVIQHMGGVGGGHYTVNICKNGRWQQCNDGARPRDVEDVGADGYMYVLRKI